MSTLKEDTMEKYDMTEDEWAEMIKRSCETSSQIEEDN